MDKVLMYVKFINSKPYYRLEDTAQWVSEPLAMWLYQDISYHLVPDGQPLPIYAKVEDAYADA